MRPNIETMRPVEYVPRRRVVVTGIGMVTNIGIGREETMQKLLEGKSGISELSFEHPEIKLAGEIKNFDPDKYVNSKLQRRAPYAGYLGLAAVDDALRHAGLVDETSGDILPQYIDKIGISVGSGIGGVYDEDEDNPKRPKESTLWGDSQGILRILPDRVASSIANRYGLEGPSVLLVAACSSGMEAQMYGHTQVAYDEFFPKIMIVGGAEAAIRPNVVNRFNQVTALSLNKKKPSLPFAENRNGFHMADGAVFLIFEEEQHALDRGAIIYADVIGFGSAGDGKGASPTGTTGKGLERAIRQALPPDIAASGNIYIEAHATATGLGDRVENKVIQTVYPNIKRVFVHTAKDNGHTLGAAGALGSALAVWGLHTGVVPPNTPKDVMKEIDFNYSFEAQEINPEIAVVHTSGFGNVNAVGVFAKYGR